jgi:hypothetical protein
MRPGIVLKAGLVLAVLALCGCSSNNTGKIEGTRWSLQPMSFQGKDLPAGTLQLEFGRDGSLVYKAATTTMTGTYSLGTGDYVTFYLDQDVQGRKNRVVTSQKIAIDGDTLTMTDADGSRGIFTKVK